MNTPLLQDKSISFSWLATWTIASAAGILGGFIVMLPLLWSIGDQVEKTIGQLPALILGGTILGTGIGGLTGLAQAAVLRQRHQPAARWITASILGGIVGSILGFSLSNAYGDNGANVVVQIVSLGLLGALLGTAQFLLSRATVPNPLWIIASGLGLALGAGILFSVPNLEVIGLVVGGLVYGISTATILWWSAK